MLQVPFSVSLGRVYTSKATYRGVVVYQQNVLASELITVSVHTITHAVSAFFCCLFYLNWSCMQEDQTGTRRPRRKPSPLRWDVRAHHSALFFDQGTLGALLQTCGGQPVPASPSDSPGSARDRPLSVQVAR